MLTLYDAPRCPYCARVRIVLAEKDVLVETVVIDLADRPAWLIAKNPPAGRVPVLEDDGWILPESVVINEYLEQRYPDPLLLPADPVATAAARLLIYRFDDLGRPYYAARRGDGEGREQLVEALAEVGAMLETMPFLTGQAFGLADAAYLPWVIRARDMLGVDLTPFPALGRWLERVSDRPSVAAELETVAALV